jgi:hypothetical protein
MFSAGGESAEELEKVNKRLAELRDRAREVAAQKSISALQDWIDNLDDEEEMYRRQNTALETNARLLERRRRAQSSVDSAETDAAVSAVENDPNRNEAEKAREVARLRNEQAEREAQRRIDEANAKAAEAERAAAEKQDEYGRANDDNISRVQGIDALEAEKADLRGKVAAAEAAAKAVEQLQKKLEDINAQIRAATAAAQGGAPQLGDLPAQRTAITSEIEAQKKAANQVTEKERERLDIIDGVINALRLSLTEHGKYVDSLRDAAEALTNQAYEIRQASNIDNDATRRETEIRNSTRSNDAEARARKIEEEARRAAEREAAEEAKRAAQEELRRVAKENAEQVRAKLQRDREEAAIRAAEERGEPERGGPRVSAADKAKQNAEKIREKQREQSAANLLQDLATELAAADTQAEIAAIREKIAAANAQLGSAIVGSLNKMLADQQALANQVKALEEKIKNSRNK